MIDIDDLVEAFASKPFSDQRFYAVAAEAAEASMGLHALASPKFRSFEIAGIGSGPDVGKMSWLIGAPNEVSRYVNEVANKAWAESGLADEPLTRPSVIQNARAEFARSELAFGLEWLVRLNSPYVGDIACTKGDVVKQLRSRDWTDADGIVRNPIRLDEGPIAAERFSWWCNNYFDPDNTDDIAWKKNSNQLRYVVALTWLDECACLPAASESLLFESIALLHDAGKHEGWRRAYEHSIEKKRTAGQQGARKRHSGTSALKQWVAENVRAETGSDTQVARKLFDRAPSDLVGASKNPQRLIYEAVRELRAWRIKK